MKKAITTFLVFLILFSNIYSDEKTDEKERKAGAAAACCTTSSASAIAWATLAISFLVVTGIIVAVAISNNNSKTIYVH